MKRPLILTLAVIIISLFCVGGIQFWRLFGKQPHSETANPQELAAIRDHVTLSVEKFEAAGIELTTAVKRELRPQRIVPGRIEYNDPRHVLVKSPFDGLIRRIDVKVGDRVSEGQVMGIVDSPELGDRRADVLLRKTDLEQARNEHDWWHSIQVKSGRTAGPTQATTTSSATREGFFRQAAW